MRIIGSLLIMVMVFANPQVTGDAARQALLVFGHDIVPSLYPYMVLTRLLADGLREKKAIPICGFVMLGMLGGSPTGASVLASLFDTRPVNRRTLFMLCTVTGTISPAFLLHTVGNWFGQSHAYKLIISHYSGAFLAGAFVYYAFRSETTATTPKATAQNRNNGSAITECVTSVLGVGGCLVFYSVMSSLVKVSLPRLSSVASAMIHASLEIAGGLKSLASLSGKAVEYTEVLCAVSCGFSGVSMLSQNYMFLRRFNVRMIDLLYCGILRAFFSGVAMLLLSMIV